MVQKKLNFNQPILSVRKYSPKMASQLVDERKGNNALPVIPSLLPHTTRVPESISGPVRNPGSVPFVWEQIPGRPKEEILTQSHNYDIPYVSADLPHSEMEARLESSQNFDECGIISKSDDCEECSEAVLDGLNLLRETDDLGFNSFKARNQQQEQRRKVVTQDKPILLHCRPKEGSDDGGDKHENVITVCCLLPRSCLKTSFCVDPVPAMRVINRVMTFPLSSSSTDSENEYAVKPIDEIQTDKLEEDNKHEHGLFLDEFPRKKSYKTLQELILADEERLKVEKGDGESDNKTSDELKMDEISDSDQEWSSEDNVVRVAVKNARKQKQLSRAATFGNVVPTPPLPESPSDSWLSRTLSSSASMKKASSSTFTSRFSNKY